MNKFIKFKLVHYGSLFRLGEKPINIIKYLKVILVVLSVGSCLISKYFGLYYKTYLAHYKSNCSQEYLEPFKTS